MQTLAKAIQNSLILSLQEEECLLLALKISMVYLSLGSTLDRQLFLQLAIGLITYRIGEVKQVSYRRNSCSVLKGILLQRLSFPETALSPQEVLEELIAIEIILGRKERPQKNTKPEILI